MSKNNTFIGGLVNSSLGNLIYIESGSNNNIFKDLILLNAVRNDTYLTYNSVNNTFINVTMPIKISRGSNNIINNSFNMA